MIRPYYRCYMYCINEPVIFSHCAHLKLGHWFHAIVDKHCEAWQILVRQPTAGRQTARRQLLLTLADRKIMTTEKTLKKRIRLHMNYSWAGRYRRVHTTCIKVVSAFVWSLFCSVGRSKSSIKFFPRFLKRSCDPLNILHDPNIGSRPIGCGTLLYILYRYRIDILYFISYRSVLFQIPIKEKNSNRKSYSTMYM